MGQYHRSELGCMLCSSHHTINCLEQPQIQKVSAVETGTTKERGESPEATSRDFSLLMTTTHGNDRSRRVIVSLFAIAGEELGRAPLIFFLDDELTDKCN